MAKSAGNLVLVSDLLREHRPAALRLLLLDRRWDEDWDYHDDLLAAAEERVDDLYAAAGRTTVAAAAEEEVQRALLDDLNTSKAVETAIEAGGPAARAVIRLLGLPA
jgi:cysteinyl-tRNA synthetase